MELNLHKKFGPSLCAADKNWGVYRARCVYMYILTLHEGRSYF